LLSCRFGHNAAGQVYWSQNPLYSIADNTALFACIGIILLHNKKITNMKFTSKNCCFTLSVWWPTEMYHHRRRTWNSPEYSQ